MVLDDGDRVFVPPERRPIGVVFQDYLLFPHLSVLENVAFGLRSRGAARRGPGALPRPCWTGSASAGRAVEAARELSGGQAQRVALARAMATDRACSCSTSRSPRSTRRPRRGAARPPRAIWPTFPGIRLLVTHDPLDAAALADRLVILERGRVVQCRHRSPTSRTRPRSSYVAELVGVNLLHGDGARAHAVDLDSGATLIVAERGPVPRSRSCIPHSVAL